MLSTNAQQRLLAAAQWLRSQGELSQAQVLLAQARAFGPGEGPAGPIPLVHVHQESAVPAVEASAPSEGAIPALEAPSSTTGPENGSEERSAPPYRAWPGTLVAIREDTRLADGAELHAGRYAFRYRREVGSDGGVRHWLDVLDGEAVHCSTQVTGATFSVGREGCDLSLPDDSTLARCQFELTPGPWVTYVSDVSGGEGTFMFVPRGAPASAE